MRHPLDLAPVPDTAQPSAVASHACDTPHNVAICCAEALCAGCCNRYFCILGGAAGHLDEVGVVEVARAAHEAWSDDHDPSLSTSRGYDPTFDAGLALIVHRSTVWQIELIDEDRRWSRQRQRVPGLPQLLIAAAKPPGADCDQVAVRCVVCGLERLPDPLVEAGVKALRPARLRVHL
eukprot:3379540-Prymnesium_polylepis.1